MAHGGDGAGSIRIPAAYCGVFGLKPSRNRTPSGSTMMRIWRGMVSEHVLTRSVRDSAAMLDVLAGADGSANMLPKPRESFLACLETPVKKLRIAVSSSPFFPQPVAPAYREALQQTAKLCESLGHTLAVDSFRIHAEEVMQAFLTVLSAETAVCIKLLKELLQDKADKHDLELATAVICKVGEQYSAEDFATASHILDQAEQEALAFFENYDMLLTPTMAIPPPKLGELTLQGIEKNIIEIVRRMPYGPLLNRLTERGFQKTFAFTAFTSIFNISGQPAMSVPLYRDSSGLPIGMQFASKYGDEKTLLQLAKQLETSVGWGRPLNNYN
jgi:amidase